MGMAAPSKSFCGQGNQTDCCKECLPYASQHPFYQPGHSKLEGHYADQVYFPQMGKESDEQETPLASSERPNSSYNPAITFFISVRNALRSRAIIPAQSTRSSAGHFEV